MEEINPAQNTDIIAPEASLVLYEEAQETAQEMEFHEYCKLFPPLPDEELADLAKDIAKLGQLEPVTRYEGKILDGQNRYKACRLAGVEPRFEDYGGNDPLGFVIAKNMTRRHLTASQRAMIAAELETLGHGGARQDAKLRVAVTRSEAADRMGVSERSVFSAKMVLDEGPDDLIEAVRLGEMSVFNAEAQIKQAAGGGKTKATGNNAANKVTGEQRRARGEPSQRTPSLGEAFRKVACEFTDRLVALCPADKREELAEMAGEAERFYGEFCRDFINRLRQAEAEADQREGAEAA